MRTLINYIVILTIVFIVSCGNNSQEQKDGEVRVSPDIVNNPETASGEITDKTGVPKFDFEEITFDLGTVQSGESVTHEFKFKNSGDKDLIISQAKGSCGCTVPDWPKEPIAPGETGKITVHYDTQRAGAINKSVTINSNAINEPIKVIRIKGNVLPQPETGAPVNNSGAPNNN